MKDHKKPSCKCVVFVAKKKKISENPWCSWQNNRCIFVANLRRREGMGRGAWPDSVEDWNNQRVLVTGGAGFLGSFIVERWQTRGAAESFVPRCGEYKRSLR